MKKLTILISSLLLMLTAYTPVLASVSYTVDSLDASYSNHTITFSGDVTNCLAVAIVVYDPDDVLIGMTSSSVNSDDSFTSTISVNLTKGGTYTLKAANYDGGDFKETTFAVYRVTYNLDGGSNHSSNPIVFGPNETVTLSSPSRSGYNFGGWYSDSALTTAMTGWNGGSGDRIVYAKWNAIPSDTTITLPAVIVPAKKITLTADQIYQKNLTSLDNLLSGETPLNVDEFKALLKSLLDSGNDFTSALSQVQLTLFNQYIELTYKENLLLDIQGASGIDIQGYGMLASLADLVAGKDVNIQFKVSTVIQASDQSALDDYLANQNLVLDNSYVLDFSLNVQSESVTQFDYPLTITIPVPEQFVGKTGFTLLHVHDGVVTPIEYVLNGDGTLTFTTQQFSSFVLVESSIIQTPILTETPQKTSNSFLVYAIVSGAALILVLILYFYFRRIGSK